MKKKRNVVARTFKDTFWCKKRVEGNFKVTELAELIGCSRATMGAYLTGFLMPSDSVIQTLCELFGVEFIKGKREFIKAHKSYDVEHKRTLKARGEHKEPVRELEVEEPKTEVVQEKSVMNDTEKMGAILRLVYSSRKLDYDTFCKLSQMSFDRLKETVYSKVDYAVYTTIENIIDGKCVKVENFDSKWDIP